MEVTGTVKLIMPQTKGVGKNGKDWTKQEFLLEYADNPQYPNQILFTVFNDKPKMQYVGLGDTVKVQFSISTKEYQGKYFISCTPFKTETLTKASASNAPQNNSAQGGEPDNLPF